MHRGISSFAAFITKGSMIALQVLDITISSCCTPSVVQQSSLVTYIDGCCRIHLSGLDHHNGCLVVRV